MFLIYLPFVILILYLLRKYFFNAPETKLTKDMTGKIIIITGSSAGIGKETAKDLLKKGAKVIFANRDEKKTMTVINEILSVINVHKDMTVFEQLDLSSFYSVLHFSEKIRSKFDHIDILINNAGMFSEKYAQTSDGHETTFQTNHVSPSLLTGLLIDLVGKSKDGRIINVSSDAHKFYDNNKFVQGESNYSMFNTYACSKLGNIICTNILRKFCEMNKLDIISASVHPGAVKTEIVRPENKSQFYKLLIHYVIYPMMLFFFKTEYMGAQTTLHLCYIDRNSFVDCGYYANCKLCKPGKTLNDQNSINNINKATFKQITDSEVYPIISGCHAFKPCKQFIQLFNTNIN